MEIRKISVDILHWGRSVRFESLMRTVFLALVFLLLLQNNAFAQDNGTTIRVGIFQNQPIVFIDDNGVPKGLYIDLLREIAGEEGWDIQYMPGTWAECLERLRSTEIDLMTSIAYLDEREVYMDFSHENVLTMWGQVYVHQDSDIQDILDLQGETVAILNGGINGINFMDMASKFDIQCEFTVAGTYTEVAELVASGSVAAGVINNVHGYEEEKQYAIKRSPIIFNPFSLLFVVPEGKNRHLLETIDSYLAKWKSDPESPYYSITAKWFGQKEKEVLPDWVFRALLVGVGIALFVTVWVFILRRQVKIRTKELAGSREELQKAYVEVEKKVEERTKELSQSNRDLANINQELESFSYAISHDLRAPLRSIDGFSHILQEDYIDRLDEKGNDCLQRILSAAQRMRMLIDGILNLSRIARGEVKWGLVDLSSLVQSIAAELQESQPQRQVEFIIAPGLTANGNAHLLRILLENLLGNAWKFTGKHLKARIEFGTTQVDGEEAFFIRDNGAGFDMTYADKLFGIFQRLHAADEFPGTGVGLATVRRVAYHHGGRVWAEGKVEKGATFYFTL
jgi:signal transduction histidine kinase